MKWWKLGLAPPTFEPEPGNVLVEEEKVFSDTHCGFGVFGTGGKQPVYILISCQGRKCVIQDFPF